MPSAHVWQAHVSAETTRAALRAEEGAIAREREKLQRERAASLNVGAIKEAQQTAEYAHTPHLVWCHVAAVLTWLGATWQPSLPTPLRSPLTFGVEERLVPRGHALPSDPLSMRVLPRVRYAKLERYKEEVDAAAEHVAAERAEVARQREEFAREKEGFQADVESLKELGLQVHADVDLSTSHLSDATWQISSL